MKGLSGAGRTGRLVTVLAALALCCAALIGATGAGAATKKKGTKTFSGKTGASQPISFKVSDKRVTSFTAVLAYNGACGQGAAPLYHVKIASMKIKNGKFRATVHTSASFSPPNSSTIKAKVNGKLSGAHASGTITAPSATCGNNHKPYLNTTFNLTGH